MSDIVEPAVRSRMMSRIRSKDTAPEMAIRKRLHAAGFRYRLHRRDLPGTPDVVLPGRRAVIFVHGCFWHGHECSMFRWPSTRVEFWTGKICGNRDRDADVRSRLLSAGWRRLVIWECALRGRDRLDFDGLIERVISWIESDHSECELSGSSVRV